MRQRVDCQPIGATTKLALYSGLLAVALGGGAVVGATIGPDGDDTTSGGSHGATHDSEMSSAGAEEAAPGTSMTADGYTLDLETRSVPAGIEQRIEFSIVGADGSAVVDFDVEHDKELHLVVVGRDLSGYAHVHPVRNEAGLWSVELLPLEAGSYRVFADFVPAGGDGVTLGADLTVLGDVADAAVPMPSRSTSVDGYEVSVDGDLVAVREATVTITVRREDEAVTDLDPYLGALGHLVAIRDGDMAYLHVHPLDELDGPGGPAVRFTVEVPTAGTYGLFFDFAHAGEVRTAAFVVTADRTADNATHRSDEPATADADHDDGHGG